MIVAIVGTRDFKGLHLVIDMVKALKEKYQDQLMIISGGGGDVDVIAIEQAQKLGIQNREFKADWAHCGPGCPPGHMKMSRHGKYCPFAGLRRNTKIVMAAEKVIAFWDGESKGTLDTIKKAVKNGRGIQIIGEPRA